MSKQPKALRLADAIDSSSSSFYAESSMSYDHELAMTVDAVADELRRLHAVNGELLEALKAYRTARSMPSYGNYAEIQWESKAGPVNPVWGGGDCAKHGRWYGRCHCCEEEFRKLCERADRDAVHARDNALRSADEMARTAIDKAEAA